MLNPNIQDLEIPPFKPKQDVGSNVLQANNVFIFPGVGFGAVMSKAKFVSDDMFLAAASALADYVDKDRIMNGTVYPELEHLRDISAVVSLIISPSSVHFTHLYASYFQALSQFASTFLI